jgi:hypothetical protein
MVLTDEERKARKKALGQTPEAKARAKAYNARPEVKAKGNTPEVKARQKALNQTPERKAHVKAYNARPEEKAKRKAYQQTSEYKEMKKKYREAYNSKSENKIKIATYTKARNSRPEVKAKANAYMKEYNLRPENLEKSKRIREDKRLKILQHYSLSLSNSNIPCCNCCGENFDNDFLAIDHVLGRKEMESIPELMAIGYSSKLENESLMRWIIKNNFPEGFMILCHNCNMAKGMKKNNNKCPHEMK